MQWRVKCWALLKFHYMRERLKITRSTQAISLLGKIQVIRQSAGNQTSFYHDGVGSSETTREILEYKNTYSLNFDDNFKYWFIGFAEGDGAFIVHKNGYLEFKVTQSSADAQILFYIKKQLGFGSVVVQCKKSKTHQFRVRDKKGVLTLIKIFNGNLLLEKECIRFNNWVNAFNSCYKSSIRIANKTNRSSLENAWLSGFTDAEGCFCASAVKRSSTYTQIEVRYTMSQKRERGLMTSFSLLLDGKVYSYKGQYQMRVNLRKLRKVLCYFQLYPLRTKKSNDFLIWVKIYKLVISKQHLTSNGLIKVQNLIDKLNR